MLTDSVIQNWSGSEQWHIALITGVHVELTNRFITSLTSPSPRTDTEYLFIHTMLKHLQGYVAAP